MVVRPGSPVTRSTNRCGVDLRLQPYGRPPSLPAHIKEEMHLLAEGGVEAAVDERVVAGGAHCQPVKAEVEGVGGVDGLAGQQHHVAVEGEPADSKHADHQKQHGQRASALLPLSGVLSCCGVTDGVVAPQPTGHCDVGRSDDKERQHVQQYEGQEVNILPVDVRWLWEVWDTQAALLFLTGQRMWIQIGGKVRTR